jgi:hypothetical protein
VQPRDARIVAQHHKLTDSTLAGRDSQSRPARAGAAGNAITRTAAANGSTDSALTSLGVIGVCAKAGRGQTVELVTLGIDPQVQGSQTPGGRSIGYIPPEDAETYEYDQFTEQAISA